MRVSSWIDELPLPNGSDPVHEGGTVSKGEVILFPRGLLQRLLAHVVQAVRELGHSKPWVPQVYLGSRSEQVGLGVGSRLVHPGSPSSPCTEAPPPLCASFCGSDRSCLSPPHACLPFRPVFPSLSPVWRSPYRVPATLTVSLILPAIQCSPPSSVSPSFSKNL